MNATCDPQRNAIKPPPLPLTGTVHVTRLPVKVDGQTEHVFIAILNNEAIGQVIAKVQPWRACGVRMMFVTPKHRHQGIGTRLLKTVEQWARAEKCEGLEIGVHKGNAEGRRWWINRKFMDAPERDSEEMPDYQSMIKPL